MKAMAKQPQDIIVPDRVLADKIYRLRHENVMLDRDLADLYGVKPFRLREQVRRNIEKFPEHFMFQLTEQEVDLMVSHFAIPSRMLSNVLKSDLATKISIKLIELFVQLRKSLHSYSELRLEIEQIKTKLNNQDKNMEVVFQYLDELADKIQQPETERKQIGYEIGRKK